MPKLFFVVGPIGTHRGITVGLIELCKSLNKTFFEVTLGANKNIAKYGSSQPDVVVTRVAEHMAAPTEDVIIFNGFKIAEHIGSIYPVYKDKATFIFSRERFPGSTSESLRFHRKYAPDDVVDNVVNSQKTAIAKLVSDHNLDLSYRSVNWDQSMFEGSVLNSEEGVTEIAVLGSLNLS
jgi:hypothetical protein